MIVYGDPQYETTLSAMVRRLASAIETTARTPANSLGGLDRLRDALIVAGQLEQAVADGLDGILSGSDARHVIDELQSVTDQLAAALCAALPPSGMVTWSTERGVRSMRAAVQSLDSLKAAPDAPLTVKVPEGFAFYALYPEAYLAAARCWLDEQAGTRGHRALVVGIRSIGTTLSAVVGAALGAAGWKTRRLTVRPAGEPFARVASINATDARGVDWALVVDEGPGLSGSSMASVGEALVRAGIARHRIVFFPGHGGEPGGAARRSVRDWWARTPRAVTPLAELRWHGQRLEELLAAESERVCNRAVIGVEDSGGGLWRAARYASSASWPAVCAPFERPAYRCLLADGAAVLWTFTGLAGAPEGENGGPESTAARITSLARDGWTVPPLAVALGFVGSRWLAGTPLRRDDASPAVLERIGRYIARAAGPPLSHKEAEPARQRLDEMIYWNVWEILGEAAAERVRTWHGAAPDRTWADPSRRYGDGRLAPHEWVRTVEGAVMKVDAAGHEQDHTVVGVQPIDWDIAGAIVEWDLTERAAAPLLAAVEAGGVAPPSAASLAYYRLAYTAFRAGQTSMCAGMTADPLEHARLQQAHAGYRGQLVALVDGSALR